MTFLLDVNVLIALIDPTHVSHDAAHAWFAHEGRRLVERMDFISSTLIEGRHPAPQAAASS